MQVDKDLMIQLQLHTYEYRIAAICIAIGVYILVSTLITVFSRKKGGLNVCALGYVPVINLTIPFVILFKGIFSLIFGVAKSAKKPKVEEVVEVEESEEDEVSEEDDLGIW